MFRQDALRLLGASGVLEEMGRKRRGAGDDGMTPWHAGDGTRIPATPGFGTEDSYFVAGNAAAMAVAAALQAGWPQPLALTPDI